MTDDSLIISLGEKKLYEKEAPGAWLYRVLGLSVSAGDLVFVDFYPKGIVLQRPDGRTEKVGLVGSRLLAFKAWMQEKAAMSSGRNESAAVVVIADPTKEIFLIQRKDDKYPSRVGKERFALFGGGVNIGEDVKSAMVREIYEEIRQVSVADQIVERSVYKGCEELSWLGERVFPWHWFVACAQTDHQFHVWTKSLLRPAGTAEAVGAMITRSVLENVVIAAETEQPGSFFLGSTYKLLLMS